VIAMSRDHRKLRVFSMADSLAVEIYGMTSTFPAEERFGVRAQMRRAAVSTASNIVEGCARRSTGEYVNFLNIAAGSAAEACYLIGLSCRLGFVPLPAFERLDRASNELVASLHALIHSLSPPRA